MLSSVFRNKQAVATNIQITCAFGRLRGLAAAHIDITRQLDELEAETTAHDTQFAAVFEESRRLVAPSPHSEPLRRQIGFVIEEP